jgi:TolB-like protein
MSEKKDQEYFADGMAEEIIDLLAKIPHLKAGAVGRISPGMLAKTSLATGKLLTTG